MLKGHLDAIILSAVSGGKAHGYAIIDEIRRRSGGTFDLPEGTIYPALHRLEQAGMLESSWSEEGGRRRRVYSLTGSGAASLVERTENWRRFASAVDNFLPGAAT